MFFPSAHVETRIPVLRRLIRDNPLGVITTAISSTDQPLILSSHIPWLLDISNEDSESELGRLRGHIARQNPQARAMIECLTTDGAPGSDRLEQEVLVLFTATPQHYVTPKFYTETKPTTAKVVPTWNYAAVQAYGRATIYHDKSQAASDFLNKQISDLSQFAETTVMDYTGKGDKPGPWKVSDAPENYIEILKKNIIGIEIVIDRLEGKFKMSQEMRKSDRDGVVKGFSRLDTEHSRVVADLVQERSDLREAARAH